MSLSPTQSVSLHTRLITIGFLAFSVIAFYGYILLKPHAPNLPLAATESFIIQKDKRQDVDVFALAMQMIRKHEGHQLNKHIDDRGGTTKFGISQRSYPHLPIARLNWNDACKIYKKDYWNRYHLERIRYPQIAVKVMDMTVHMGPKRAHQIIKYALAKQKVPTSAGSMKNPAFIRSINQAAPSQLLKDLRMESGAFFQRLAANDESQSRFLNGWMKRARA